MVMNPQAVGFIIDFQGAEAVADLPERNKVTDADLNRVAGFSAIGS
jgi:hypothetical protein